MCCYTLCLDDEHIRTLRCFVHMLEAHVTSNKCTSPKITILQYNNQPHRMHVRHSRCTRKTPRRRIAGAARNILERMSKREDGAAGRVHVRAICARNTYTRRDDSVHTERFTATRLSVRWPLVSRCGAITVWICREVVHHTNIYIGALTGSSRRQAARASYLRSLRVFC